MPLVLNPDLEIILFVLNAIGIIVFSSAGFIVSKKYKLDILGIYFICVVSSLVGGIMKDVMLNKIPIIFISIYPILISISTVTVLIFMHEKIKKYEKKKIFLLLDAIGLCAFSVIGALDGIAHNLNIFGILFLGMITAVGGGITRDIITNNIPVLLKEDFYATISLIVAFFIYLLYSFERLFYLEIIIVIILGVLLRSLVIYKKIFLPK